MKLGGRFIACYRGNQGPVHLEKDNRKGAYGS